MSESLHKRETHAEMEGEWNKETERKRKNEREKEREREAFQGAVTGFECYFN